MRDLCISEKSRKEIDDMISNWDYQIYVDTTSLDDELITIAIANCQFKSVDSAKEKLLQFPEGTVFKLKTAPTRGGDSRLEDVVQQIRHFLKEHGMSLKSEPER